MSESNIAEDVCLLYMNPILHTSNLSTPYLYIESGHGQIEIQLNRLNVDLWAGWLYCKIY